MNQALRFQTTKKPLIANEIAGNERLNTLPFSDPILRLHETKLLLPLTLQRSASYFLVLVFR